MTTAVASPATANTSPSDRLQCIDVLRGVAILGVILMHIPHDAPGGFRLNPWFFPAWFLNFGYIGVHLFVLISGFCIHRRAAIEKKLSGHWNISWGRFWLRRFWRLYPPYLVAIGLSILAARYLHDRAPEAADPRTADIVAHVLMAHNLFREFATSLGNGAFWSLGMEDQLYGLYALFLVLLHRLGVRTTLLAVFCVTLIWRTVWPILPEPSLAQDFTLGKFYLWPFMLWLHWTLGAIAADAYFGNVTPPKIMTSRTTMALLFGCGVLVNQKTFALIAATGLGQRLAIDHGSVAAQIISSLGELCIGLALFMLLCRALQAEQTDRFKGRLAQVLARLGRVSYSLYLTHVPILLILEHHLPIADTRFQWPLRIAVYLSICIVLGTTYFLIVERWFLSGKCPIRLRRPALEASGVAIP